MPPQQALSLWHATAPADELALVRPALDGDLDVDIAIVGGGFTGLWTAYYLHLAEPRLRIAILEGNVVGFGASGRNGGWCSSLLPMSLEAIAHERGDDQASRLQRAMYDTVDEIAAVTAAEGIDCHFAKGGYVQLARTPLQAQRIRAEVDSTRRFGIGDDDYRWLTPDEARQHVGASRVHGAAFTPHCAAIHPLRLARGLARAVERQGTTIFENTRVSEIAVGRAVTSAGTVAADVVVRATEAFTPHLKGMRRTVAPIYSLMIATDPLPTGAFEQIGLRQRQTFNDARRMIIYGQRTADDRLAFGGRGAPYHFASAIKPEFDRNDTVRVRLADTLRDLFPVLADAEFTHHWGGAVAAPRDWWCSVGYDPTTTMAWAGGYVGDGVATTNLAGRTLAHLITANASDLTTLPWVGHRSRRWEPEPLRWIGINTMVRLPDGADRYEERTGRSERWRTALIGRLTGH